MSLRYCWEQRTIKSTFTIKSEYGIMYVDNINAPRFATSYTTDTKTGTYKLSGTIVSMGSGGHVNAHTYQYAMPNGTSGNELFSTHPDYVQEKYVTWDYDNNRISNYTMSGMIASPMRHYFAENQSAGDLIGTIIGTTASQYPSNGVSGSYWYIYQGSDSIDPVAVNLSQSSGLYVGLPITISVDPSTSKVYGGNVSYQYQVQINNDGQWVTLGTTTETSYAYTIPTGATNLQFRVLASDDLGFTSTDYVNSASVSVVAFKPGTQQVLHRKNASGGYDVIWLETDSEVVIRPDGTTLDATLVDIESRLSGLGV